MEDVIILQNENKIKAALGKNVKIRLPKTFYPNKEQTKGLEGKGVPTDIVDDEFKTFLDLNKIDFPKAERIKIKKDSRVLQIFHLEIENPTEAEALISENLTCQETGIIYKVKECRSPFLVQQYFNCQNFGHSTKNCRLKQKCLICGENHSHKTCTNREARKPKCASCKGPHVCILQRMSRIQKAGIQATSGQ